ncbi:glucose-6-phosphate isomerase [Candidatus Peregrinibacteria bacterium]|nr:glucose-6-phosphate isomerase [Candidatus Peregrinibacteria bacterium]
MLSINTENLDKIDSAHGLTQGEIEKETALIDTFLENIHKRKQGFYKIIDDSGLHEKVHSFAANAKTKYKDIVILGIGGSALGTICLQQTLKHLYENELDSAPKLHVLDNIDPELIAEIQDIISLESTLFIVVTKSGGTPETISQYFYFRNLIDNKGFNPQNHFIFITDPEKGLLRKIATEEHFISFEVPPDVGGRFSVLTAVGLVPAAIIGIDIDKLIEGAKSMRDNFLDERKESNLPFKLATIQYLLEKKGKSINIIIPYAQKLIKFADWYKQLLAESIGKKSNENGEDVFTGITPVNALGVTDQHSQSQLYNEGPNDKLLLFIKTKEKATDISIPNLFPENESLSYLNDLTFGKLIDTEMEGTLQALTKNDRPTITIEIDKINAYALGELFMLFEAATAFLGEFYNINAFDQPGVELSKILTKQLLTPTENDSST